MARKRGTKQDTLLYTTLIRCISGSDKINENESSNQTKPEKYSTLFGMV